MHALHANQTIARQGLRAVGLRLSDSSVRKYVQHLRAFL